MIVLLVYNNLKIIDALTFLLKHPLFILNNYVEAS